MKRTAAALTLVASLGLSLAACTPSGPSPAPAPTFATPAAPASPSASPVQSAAKNTTDKFIQQVREEAQASMDAKKPENEQEAQAQFLKLYPKSLAFVKDDAMTLPEKQTLIAVFARSFIADPSAVISADASSFVEKSSTEASIKGGKFTVIVRGQNLNSAANADKGGDLVWSKIGEDWKIIKFTTK